MNEDAGRFWDERAREQALFFVDNTVDYRKPDSERHATLVFAFAFVFLFVARGRWQQLDEALHGQ